jgi:dethiobiotin synthetase
VKPLVVVSGTGTEIGKTFVTAALVTAWGRTGKSIAGIKPIESGGASDVVELGQASTFHVTRFTPPYLLMDPVSPHLAARREGRAIDLATVVAWVGDIRSKADGTVVELPGGLFTPLNDGGATNATLVQMLVPTHTILVAPDRLGVLHDVIASTRAARGDKLRISGVVLSTPATPDVTTGSNASELTHLLHGDPRIIATVPRTTVQSAQLLFHTWIDEHLA